MVEGILIGFMAGFTVPVGIAVLGGRYIAKHPEIIMRHITRKMMQAVKQQPGKSELIP